MNTTILSIRFFVKRYKIKSNRVPIYVRITINGVSVDVSLKRIIALNNWNASTQTVMGARQEAKLFNSYLEEVRAEIISCYSDLRRQKKVVTAEDIKNLYCGILPEEHSLLKLVDYHNTYLKDTIEWGTLKNYFTTQKYLEIFLKKVRKKSDMPLSELSYSFLIDFEIFLKSIKPKGNLKPCGHNTVLKHIERLRKMINVAVKNEWITRDPFAKFQAKFVKNSRQFLSEDELMQIELKYFEITRLGFARDLFVFSCYTGLAYCDVMSLTEGNITKGIDGEYWIGTARKKSH
jgi:hypothetical protein